MTALHPCVCGPNGNCPMSCPNRPKRRGAPEAAIQRAIIDRLRLYGVLCVAVPNEGKRTAVTGRRLKGAGMRPGFPDLICMQDGQAAFLEVKAPKGVVSDAQHIMHAELELQRMRVAVVRSQDEAVAALRGWGFAC
jgi:predicted ATPase with chaperone activity